MTIGVRRKKNSITIHVVDNGVGISDKKRLNLFSEFKDEDENSDPEVGVSKNDVSYGLGLNIAMSLAKICNAEINVNSRLAKGTTCILTLPRPAR
jgi:signal transduction histidine kinase